jgi:hypothetical protein
MWDTDSQESQFSKKVITMDNLPVDQFLFISDLINERKYGIEDEFRRNAKRRAEELRAKIEKRSQ